MNYSIVIPSRNSRNLRACVAAIYKNNPGSPIVVVDDGLEGIEQDWWTRYGVARIEGVRPFVWARNVNAGLWYSEKVFLTGNAIVLNDDGILETPHGFDGLMTAATANQQFGVLSPLIRGAACAPDQVLYGSGVWGNEAGRHEYLAGSPQPVQAKHHMLGFVCVALTWNWIGRLRRHSVDEPIVGSGPFDERFVGYGYDDDDFCMRVKKLGGMLGVYQGCVVEHGSLESTFRGKEAGTIAVEGESWRAAGPSLLTHNKMVFDAKWPGGWDGNS